MKKLTISLITLLLLSGCFDFLKSKVGVISKNGTTPSIIGEYVDEKGTLIKIQQPYPHLFVLNSIKEKGGVKIMFDAENIKANQGNFFIAQIKQSCTTESTKCENMDGEITIGKIEDNELTFFDMSNCKDYELAKKYGVTISLENNEKYITNVDTHQGLLDFFSSCASGESIRKGENTSFKKIN